MDFELLAKERYSCRFFDGRKPDEEILNKILEIANLAPTAKNMQPQKIYVLESDEALSKIDSITPIRYGSRLVLMFAYDANQVWRNPFEENITSGEQDVSIVATHVMLAAKELGVDSVWCGYFPNSKAHELFSLPENEKVVLLMPLGYAKKESKPSERHNQRKELNDIVKKL